jgi:hypothetical protein
MSELEGYSRVNEHDFWKSVRERRADTQKGLPYDHLKVSGKTGFYADGDETLWGYVVRVLADRAYYVKD